MPSSPSKPRALAYEDFIEIFAEAGELRRFPQRAPASSDAPRAEAACLAWVDQMARRGEDFEALAGSVWLGVVDDPSDDASSIDRIDADIELTPLAWAAVQGLARTVEALLAAGADPGFSFNLRAECGGVDVDISLRSLAQGWSEVGSADPDCFRMISSALEARQIAAAAPKKQSSRSLKAPRSL